MLRSVENISRRGPLNCRSLGYARDDKGESGAPRWHPLVGDKNSRFPFAMLRSVENISTKGPLNCRSLGYARDDKGRATLPWRAVAGQKACSGRTCCLLAFGRYEKELDLAIF
jgi:hypothetical protein